MKEIIDFLPGEIVPAGDIILRKQGLPPNGKSNPKVISLIEKAIDLFAELCEPIGVISDVSKAEFEAVYEGEGLNERYTPVKGIYPRADHLALFAVTVGQKVCDKISELFDSRDFALAAILDTVASEATESLGALAQQDYFDSLMESNRISVESAVLRYSPGYCGWHISGQKKLFEVLAPEEIGIELTESFLMLPLKSISGVMIAGRKEIHCIDGTYPFCDVCASKGCLERIKGLEGN